MRCPKCGGHVELEHRFCPSCSHQMTTGSSPDAKPGLTQTPTASEPSRIPEPSPPADSSGSASAILGCLGFSVLIIVIIVTYTMLFRHCSEDTQKSATASKAAPSSEIRPGIGEEGVLRLGISSPVLVAVSKEALDGLSNAVVTKDNYGLQQLLASGQVFSVDAGTKVLVIDATLMTTKVRVLEGTYIGDAGWVAREEVHAH